ncbi:IS66 family transposase [Streptococcus dysgalactiae]|uniref:IS66 family transposase n=1 Tax=Streptococcus dysgalactiae TaxID=1334 RepID=UPI003F76F6EB
MSSLISVVTKLYCHFKLGCAIDYSLNHEETFKTILADRNLVLSNNMAERAIKGLVMGRSKTV